MQDLTIRPITAEDWPAWLPLWQGYNRFYGRADSTALPEGITRNTFARFLDSREPVHALVAARLYWQTHESNRTAMRLYDKVAERSGFLVYRMPV